MTPEVFISLVGVPILLIVVGLICWRVAKSARASTSRMRGEECWNAGDKQQAIDCFNEAIRFNAKDVRAFRNRGAVFLSMRDYDSAIADFTEAILLEPENAEACFDLAFANWSRGDIDEAIGDFGQVIRLDSENVSAYFYRGVAFWNKGDCGNAIVDFTEAIRLDPEVSNAYSCRGNAFWEANEPDKAIADFTKVIELDRPELDANSDRAAVHWSKGNVDESIADLTEAIEYKPQGVNSENSPHFSNAYYNNAYYNRGMAFLSTGDYDKAIADFSDALRLYGTLAKISSDLEFAREMKGDRIQAADDRTEEYLRPLMAKAYYHRGLAHDGKGESEKAGMNFAEAEKLGYTRQ